MGCGAKYQIHKEYIAPTQNNSCVSSCLNKKHMCDTSCKVRYDRCLIDARATANVIYKEEKATHDRKYHEYELDLKRNYMLEKKEARLKKDRDYFLNDCKKGVSYACERYHTVQNQLDDMAKMHTFPKKPHRPYLANILQTEQKYCGPKCECESDFDICFSGCGGKIKVHKICIENCE